MTESHAAAVVLFDGVCGLCNWSVDFLIRRDRHGALRFAPLQSEIARTLLRERGVNAAELSSVVVIDGRGVYRQSDAALHALSRLGSTWRMAAVVASVIPRPLRDAVYNVVATNRYRWFGRRSTCRIPTPQERERFLAD